VSLDGARDHILAALPSSTAGNGRLEPEFLNLLSEFDGDVTESTDGTVQFCFPEILRQYEGAERVRRHLGLEGQTVGEIVYASDDSDAEAHERDLAAFDREMERQQDLERYIQAPDRIAFFDDFELVALEEELQTRA
jgi:hypothetical protein